MKKLMVTLMLLSVASFASAQPASKKTDDRPRATRAASGELGRMCTAEARDSRMKMGSAEHRQFMRSCMRGEAWSGNESPTARDADGRLKAAPTATRQQMQACRDQADKNRMAGPDRRDFMAQCARDAGRR